MRPLRLGGGGEEAMKEKRLGGEEEDEGGEIQRRAKNVKALADDYPCLGIGINHTRRHNRNPLPTACLKGRP